MLTRGQVIVLVVAALTAALTAACRGDAHASGPALRPMVQLPVTPGSPQNARSPIGTNLTGISDWSPEWPFVDAFKSSRAWISSTEQTWDDKRPLDVDEHGWVRSLKPGQWARTLMFWELGNVPGVGAPFPSGDYVVRYRGKGTLEVWPQAPSSVEPGRIVVHVDANNGTGLGLILKATDPADPIRDIRVFMPGFDESDATNPQRFHPVFLERLRHYKALRFMDWQNTNDSKLRTWSERPEPNDARFTNGVPVEAMVELANTLDADAWFCMPHLADDDYVTRFANYVARNLEKDRAVYIESSNEVWNAQFQQARWAADEGQKKKLASDAYQAQMRQHSARSVHVFKLFAAAFAAAGQNAPRLVRVMGAQAANAWTSGEALAWKDAWRTTDAVAIAPYFGGELGQPDQRARVAAMSLDDFMATLQTESLPMIQTWLAAHAKVSTRYGTPVIAYEGGQHLVGIGPVVDDKAVNALFDEANRDPRMNHVYSLYLKAWKDAGFGLFVHFVGTTRSSKWGRWGAAESQLQPRAKAPKLDALLTFIEQNPT